MFQFKEFDYLTNGEIDLIIEKKAQADEEKGYVPAYIYKICLQGSTDKIGWIDLRVGNNNNTKYGGHIGYEINEDNRGKHFASKACLILKQVALAHGMEKVIITCNPDNFPSRKTCERIGAELIEIADLPPENEMYKEGERQKCRYEWTLN